MTIAQKLEQNGIEKGIKKGLEQGKRDIARDMLQHGIDLNIVMKITSLSEKDLAQLCH